MRADAGALALKVHWARDVIALAHSRGGMGDDVQAAFGIDISRVVCSGSPGE
jgi:hypothetical protein